jgi:hypothetical protein
MTTTLNELNRKAHEILSRELGPTDYIRFFQQYEKGTGDYTRDRWQWLGDVTLEQIAGEVQTVEKS